MKLYELRGRDPEHRFSPYVWRTKLALAHKGLAHESVALRFTEIPEAPFADVAATVPVLEDEGCFIADSWEIACHLEERYPERPSLFGGAVGRAHARFINAWVDRTLVVGFFPLLVATPLLDRPDLPRLLRRGRRVSPERVVQRALEGARRRRRRVYVPRAVRLIAALQGLVPSLLDRLGTPEGQGGGPEGRGAGTPPAPGGPPAKQGN